MFFGKYIYSRMTVLTGALIFASHVAGQDSPIVCQVASAALQVRAEGKAERVGDITINCTGGTAGSTARTNVAVALNREITNPILNGVLRDVTLSIGEGNDLRPANVVATTTGASSFSFNGVQFTVAASRSIVMRISQVRADVSTSQQPVFAVLSFNGSTNLSVNNNTLVVGQPFAGLFVSGASARLRCVLSRFPSGLTLTDAVAANTYYFSGRVTEGFESAFTAREPGADTGTRIVLRYSGFPATTKLALPDVIAGSNAPRATSAGDFGKQVNPGQAGPGSLLLLRILGTDANGAGGFPVVQAGQALPFNSLREVGLTNGAGVAVYEVIDANPFAREHALVPTFLELTQLNNDAEIFGSLQIDLGPLGNSGVPRFADVTPPADCNLLGDCSAQYFPRLFVDSDSLNVTVTQGSPFQVRYLRIRNEGGGQLPWSARVDYRSGSNWLRLETPSGVNNTTTRLDFLPERVSGPGRYEATVTIDAGSAGTQVIPVTLTVNASQASPSAPEINSVAHAATFEDTLATGGLGVIRGLRLKGREVAVRVGGMNANVLFNNGSQINFEVPMLAGRENADLVVSVDGVASAPKPVKLRTVWPGVFPGGLLNNDGSANSEAQPAKAGSTVRVLTTGLPAAGLDAVRVRIHDADHLAPVTAALYPGATGVQYLDVVVPEGMPTMTTDLVVCSGTVCSLPVRISLTE